MALPTTALINGQFPTNPFPLGLVTVASAGTPIQLIHNWTDLAGKTCQRLVIEALHGNTTGKIIYVLIQNASAAADVTNYLNVVKELFPGETYELPAYMMNSIVLDRFWIDTDTNGQKCIATAFFA